MQTNCKNYCIFCSRLCFIFHYGVLCRRVQYFSLGMWPMIWKSVCIHFSKLQPVFPEFIWQLSPSSHAINSRIFSKISQTFTKIVRFFFLFYLLFETNKCFFYLDSTKDTFPFLIEANNNCEWFWKMYGKLLIFGYFSGNVTISTVSVAFVLIMTGEFNVKYLYHAFRVV